MMLIIVKAFLYAKLVLAVNSLDHTLWNLSFIFKGVLPKVQINQRYVTLICPSRCCTSCEHR